MPLSDDQKFSNLINALNEVMARQTRLEERMLRLEQGDLPPARVAVEPEFAPSFIPSAIAEPEPPLPPAIEPELEQPLTQTPALETKVGLTILNRIGVITLVLGIAIFFKWAVDNNWIGPSGRVILGVIAGFATLAVADILWRKAQQVFAQGLTGTGISIIFLAFYAAFNFYHLIPQQGAFVLLLATTAMAATLALRYNAIAIAALGFLGAYLTPLLLSTGEDHPWFLISYLLVVNFAATELARRRDWRKLELLSFTATILIFGTWLFKNDGPADKLPATLGALALCAQRFRTSWRMLFVIGQLLTAITMGIVWDHAPAKFFPLAIVVAVGGLAFAHFRDYPAILPTVFLGFWASIPLLQHLVPATVMPVAAAGFLLFTLWAWWRTAFLDESPTVKSMSVFALNGVAFYGIAYYVLRKDYLHLLGLLAVAVAASYLAFGMFLHRKSVNREHDKRMVLLALGIAAAFLTLAIPIQLTGFTITIAWSIQAAALAWIGMRLKSRRALFAALFVFLLALGRLAEVDSEMYPDATTYRLLFNARFFAFAVLGAAFLLAAYWSEKVNRQVALVHFVLGHIVLLAGLSLEVTGWANRSAASENLLSVETIGISILFAMYAVILVSIGVATRSAVSRLAGLALTAIVILKLYLFDVWQLQRVYQIIAFVILGILLLSTSFLYSRFKGLIDGLWRDLPKTEPDETSRP